MKTESELPVSADDELLGQLLADYLTALEAGTPLDLDDLADRHPRLAAEIRQYAASLDLLHRSTRPTPAGGQTGRHQSERRLGDFLIGEEIGRGGMGTVYEAVQISLERTVALKVLPFAAICDGKQVARFRVEAQAAAQLHHPNIVPVFAVGEDRGVHFYAMQRVCGRSLDALIRDLREAAESRQVAADGSTVDGGRDPTPAVMTASATTGPSWPRDPQRHCRSVAEIGVQAALALQHAHDYGVVHRDVKPSNLMLDRNGKAWVTDFGLARVRDGTGVTMTGDVVGTLRYMSPEQAAGRQAEVDGRTDVYGLGATLYELLTLQPAFPGDDQRHIRDAIDSRSPPSPRSINAAIPVDLETIVLQAMAKDRQDRYPTAQALADDLRCFLDGHPPRARRPSLLDRGLKWLWRHRRFAAASFAALAAITIAATVGLVLLARAYAAKEAALARAIDYLGQARAVVDLLANLADDLTDLPGSEPLRLALLQETLAYYDGFNARAGDDPTLVDQRFEAHVKVASLRQRLGEPDAAIAEFQAARRLLAGRVSHRPSDPEWRARLAAVEHGISAVLADAGRHTEAVAACDEAIRQYEWLRNGRPDDPRPALQLAEAWINRGTSRLAQQPPDLDDAVRSLQRSIALLGEVERTRADDSAVVHRLAIALHNLAAVQRQAGLPAAIETAERSVALLTRLCTSDSAPDDRLADLALAMRTQASLRSAAGEPATAIDLLRRAIGEQERLVRRSPAIVRYRRDLALCVADLGKLLCDVGEQAEADEAFRYAENVFQALVADFPGVTPHLTGLAALLNNVGVMTAARGRHADAVPLFTRAIAAQRRAMLQQPGIERAEVDLGRMLVNHQKSLAASKHGDEAIPSGQSDGHEPITIPDERRETP